KEIISELPPGTVLRQVAGGGGGFGNPFSRSADRVAKEMRNGVISPRRAREEYGVVITPGTYEVDRIKTGRLRRDR
ncbi:MAG: hypothetical protein QF888_09020, partial [Desulfobacterales bacterium]|nr:hypothetical protein [Desulfobacterales bacterium]